MFSRILTARRANRLGWGGAGSVIAEPNDISSRRRFLQASAALTLAGASTAVLGAEQAAKATPRQSYGVAKDFQSIRTHENAHVAFLVQALGGDARPQPTFTGLQQKGAGKFLALARTFENVGVGAYLGAAPYIQDTTYLAAALTIATVEARHAGYINTHLLDPITAPATDDQSDPSFDTAFTADEVGADVAPFITSLNGGPPVTYSTTPSPTNDIAILNYALALEYLEAEFYNLNVPHFYGGK